MYYVCETGRAFRARIYEHKLSVNKPKNNRITHVSKYFTGKGYSVRNMQFSILDWCTPKHNTPKQARRRRREQWWMWNIGAVHPIGINQFIYLIVYFGLPSHSGDPLFLLNIQTNTHCQLHHLLGIGNDVDK